MGTLDLRSGFPTLAKAIEAGADRPTAFRFEWNVAGKCEFPQGIELHYRKRQKADLLRDCDSVPGQCFRLMMEVKCRRCVQCLKARQREWTQRAIEEIRGAQRTWFGTLTLTEEQHAIYVARAAVRCARSNTDYEAQEPSARFYDRAKEIGPDLQRWLKRVRKASQARLRYMLVAESHESGAPHFHCLIHEGQGGRPILKAQLREQWSLGFSRWKLVEGNGAAYYACKYLSKQSYGRVRASLAYGVPHN